MNDFPYLAPPQDGLRRAMTDARRRRLRSAGFSTSSVAAAVLVLAALAGAQGSQSLVEEPAPQQPAVTRLVPGPDRLPAARSNTATRYTASQPRTGTVPAGGAAGPRAASGPAGRSGGTAQGGSAVTTGPMDRTAGSPSIDACPIEKGTSGQRLLCPSGTYGDHYDADNKVVGTDLYGSVCSFDPNLVQLHFPTSRELDFAVLDDKGVTRWRWSSEHPAAQDEHTLQLDTGECWQWSTLWRDVDTSGRRLPTGTYTLRVTSSATELGAQNVYETAISVT